MVTVSRPVGLFVAFSVVGIGIYMYASAQSDVSTGSKLAAVKSNAPDKPSDFTDEDYTARFDPPATKGAIHNVFLPLIHGETGAGPSEASLATQKDSMRVPAGLAGGDSNWIFTGFAVINGVKSALLENQSTHHSEFVNEGAPWKSTRVLRIRTGSLLFDDLAGGQVSVSRFDPVLAAKSTAKPGDAGVKPIDVGPALEGPIGPNPGGPPRGGPRRQIVNGIMPGGIVNVNGMAITVTGG